MEFPLGILIAALLLRALKQVFGPGRTHLNFNQLLKH
jgi:hypothetical protein